MDPEVALAELREIVKEVNDGTVSSHTDAMSRMADLFDGLDGWLTNGGFKPLDWRASGG